MDYIRELKKAFNSIYKSTRDKDVIDINNINVAKKLTAFIAILELSSRIRFKYSVPFSLRA